MGKAVELLQRSMRQLLDIKAHREQILSQRTLEGPVSRIKCLLPLDEDAELVMRRQGGREHSTRHHYPCYGSARRKEARGGGKEHTSGTRLNRQRKEYERREGRGGKKEGRGEGKRSGP